MKFRFIQEKQNFRAAEAYRKLRANLMFCGGDVRVIAVTSCMPDAEKSDVTRRLAVNLAEAGKRVLLIDADLRRSAMMEKVVVEGDAPGLSHLLSGQAEQEDVLLESENENLRAILAGSFPPNPAELLARPRFRELVEDMRERFDYVLIDTPPLGAVIDGAVAAGVCDGAIVVLRSGKVGCKLAREVKAQLEKANCRVLGVVLNGADAEKNSAYYGSPRFAAGREAKRK